MSEVPSHLPIGANSFDKVLRRTLDNNEDWPWVSGSTNLLRPDLQDDRNSVSKTLWSFSLKCDFMLERTLLHSTSFPSYVMFFPSFRAAMSGPIAAVPLW